MANKETLKGGENMNFKGNYKNYYEYVKQLTLFDNDKIRIRKNFYNLGLWIVKDSQSKYTLNIFKYRIRF